MVKETRIHRENNRPTAKLLTNPTIMAMMTPRTEYISGVSKYKCMTYMSSVDFIVHHYCSCFQYELTKYKPSTLVELCNAVLTACV